MKYIQLKKRVFASDVDVIRDVLSNHQARGITVGEMSACVKILDKLNAGAPDLIALEDTEHSVLLKYFEAFPFAVAHRDLVELGDAIRSAPSESVRCGFAASMDDRN